MAMCPTYPGTNPFTFASGESKFTDNCNKSNSQFTTCEYCEGEGWIYAEAEGCAWPCPECGGSGWVEGEAASLTLEDLDLRAPIDTLLAAWSDLAAKSKCLGLRRRIAGVCEKRLSWQYRASEC